VYKVNALCVWEKMMGQSNRLIDVYLEIGSKRVVAAATEWPGWCRIARDEASALDALLAYGERYERVARVASLSFQPPSDIAMLNVVERLKGSSMTDFGAIEAIPSIDHQPFDGEEFRRSQALLRAAWNAFDKAVAAARDKALKSGPRGGGRELDEIVEHVIGADEGHLSRLGRKHKPDPTEPLDLQLAHMRDAMFEMLQAAVRGEIAEKGPRGGKRPPVRFIVRRAVWHVLDHAWEIEDRSITEQA
jgi:hypothetical protein